MQLFSNKYIAVLRMNWIQALEYRANALVGVFAIISGLFIEYQIWSLIFESNNQSPVYMSGTSEAFLKIQKSIYNAITFK